MLSRPCSRLLSRSAVTAAAVALAVPAAAGVGYAASIGLGPAGLASAGAAVGRCDTGTWTISYQQSAAGAVTGVLVGSVGAGCNGRTVNIALRKQSAAPVATGSATITGGTATVTNLSTTPAYDAVDRVDLVVVGP